jgi:ADP-dependent phosphofructokinase/glucokinase
MKTREEKIKQLNHLIKRKDRIRVKHLMAIKQHLQDVKDCEEYIKKKKEELEVWMKSEG